LRLIGRTSSVAIGIAVVVALATVVATAVGHVRRVGDVPSRATASLATDGLTFSVEYAGTYTAHASDKGGYHVEDISLKWNDEVPPASQDRLGVGDRVSVVVLAFVFEG
jgi:hypothetical protein